MTIRNYIISAMLLLCPLFMRAQELPAWHEGWLDIHHIATGKGENSFYVFPDGTTMLVDLGDETNGRFKCPAYPDASLTPAQWVARYIGHFASGTPGKGTMVDYFSLSHFDSDHMGCPQAMRPGDHYALCGIMDGGEILRFGKIVDRAYPDYAEIATNAAVVGEYAKFVAYQRESLGTMVERFKVGSHSQFGLKYAPKDYKKSFDVHNIASNGYVVAGKNSKIRPMFRDSDISRYDENMLSNVFVISYGPFRYYNGGDIGGGMNVSRDNWWRDFESQVADVIGPVTVMKADHHAWKDALNPHMLYVMQPDVIVTICSHINHPWKATVQRLMDTMYPVKADLYTTTDSGREQVGAELFDAAVKACGHIVIRVYEGGKSYQVFVLDAKSTDYKVIYSSDIVVL